MLMRNQGQPIIDRAVEREKINEDREDNLKKSSDKIIETEQSARSSWAQDEENRTTRSSAEPKRDRQRATVLRACVRGTVSFRNIHTRRHV